MMLSRFKHFLLIQLLEPTLGSSLFALAFALLTLLIGRLPRLSSRLNSLYIPQAINNIKHDIGHTLLDLLTHSLHGYGNNFFLVLFWVLVGIIIYFLLHGLGSIFLDLEENLEERNFLWPSYANRNQHLAIFITKTGFRIAVSILMLIYLLVVTPKILHVLNQVLDRAGTGVNLAEHYAYFLLIAWLVGHGFVVLLRLITLRTRLFYMA